MKLATIGLKFKDWPIDLASEWLNKPATKNFTFYIAGFQVGYIRTRSWGVIVSMGGNNIFMIDHKHAVDLEPEELVVLIRKIAARKNWENKLVASIHPFNKVQVLQLLDCFLEKRESGPIEYDDSAVTVSDEILSESQPQDSQAPTEK